MTPLERAGFLAHARLPAFARKVEAAQTVVRDALELGAAYVACSWGKDSVVLAHLAQQVQAEIPLLFFCDPDQDALDNYQETQERYRTQFPHTVYEEVWFAGDRIPDKVQAAAVWERYPVALIGIREEEASYRRMEAKRHGLIYQYTSGTHAGSWRVWPLARWTWQDVWAYVCRHDLPMLASYEHVVNADRAHSRTCNVVAKHLAYGPKGSGMGRIAQLRARNPAYFNHLAQFYPEIARLGG